MQRDADNILKVKLKSNNLFQRCLDIFVHSIWEFYISVVFHLVKLSSSIMGDSTSNLHIISLTYSSSFETTGCTCNTTDAFPLFIIMSFEFSTWNYIQLSVASYNGNAFLLFHQCSEICMIYREIHNVNFVYRILYVHTQGIVYGPGLWTVCAFDKRLSKPIFHSYEFDITRPRRERSGIQNTAVIDQRKGIIFVLITL